MKKTKRDIIYLVIAAIMIAAGLALIYWGFATQPKGEIHYTVLVAYGETLSFAGAVMGIAYSSKLAIEKIRRETLERGQQPLSDEDEE